MTQDKEELTNPGVHHLRYAHLPHTGNATETQPWVYAYEFNQPLIAAWKMGQTINVQLPFDEETNTREFENLENGSAMPNTFSLLSAQNVVIADLYRDGNQIETIVLNYDPTKIATIQLKDQQITVPQSVFTLMPLSSSSLNLPIQK